MTSLGKEKTNTRHNVPFSEPDILHYSVIEMNEYSERAERIHSQ